MRPSVPVALLLCAHLAALGAGFLAPYHYAEQFRSSPLEPPTRVHLRDEEGRWRWPFVVSEGAEGAPTPHPLSLLVSRPMPHPGGLFGSGWHLFGAEEPGRIFLLGTDALGRDVFSRLVYGARVSLLAGLGGAVLALALAVALGGVAGQRSGGMVDAVVMGASELFLALPWLYLLLAARAFLPLDLSPTRAFLVIVSILGLVGWAGPARLVRASVAAASQRDFVVAARAAGASRARVLRRHLLPPSLGVVRTQAALLVPQFVLAEVALSFVGLGVSEPVPSWGNMLAALQQYHVVSRAWWMFAPGVALVLVGWCYHAWAVDAETRGRRVAS